ncbi:MAG TPA: tRNA (adenosine(37)-N6)-threonylcarbamoyltransferase complex dimerization subunit type 1 TsaB [Candidatus Eremiobacteraceae bacterium]|jgi:tRNA threonylcarbamoyl adenosine modification protein YeaZ|nr:tRNA (adenosine(37)-N6)-threonylcarbamoyltransferase complex dimerization subunit type 1 TsaB [Candidatus Eremiobacteraceae bacterium]
MNLLALDTCDARGSVSVLRDAEVLQTVEHDTADDYSIWLLPAIDRALHSSGLVFADVDVYVAASGPGSFTGVRVGLTTVKAWAEVTGKPIVGVSRLEALATLAAPAGEFVAAFTNAQRKQIFGALYRRDSERLDRIGDEAVIASDAFLAWVEENSSGSGVAWISTDPEMLTETEAWAARQKEDAARPVNNAVNTRAPQHQGIEVQSASPFLSPAIGKLGFHLAALKQFTDPLRLDANYVRRSDAEVSWIDRHERASKTAG